MPIDFDKKAVYSIDYDQMFDFIKTLPFLDDQYHKKIYLTKWQSTLQRQDRFDVENIHTLLKQSVNYRMFQYEFFLHSGNGRMLCHFDIYTLFKALYAESDNLSSLSETVPLEEIFEEDSAYLYYSRIIDPSWTFNTTPIFFCRTYDSEPRWLLIDGNHRLEHAQRLGLPNINGIFLNDDFLIRNKLFMSDFDLLLFILFREIHRFISLKYTQKATDISLLSSSYLYPF